MKTIDIELLNKNLVYNKETGIFTRIKGSGGKKAGSVAGSINTNGYINIQIKGVNYYAHRLAWLLEHGCMPSIVDHIDGNKDNNRIDNLREVTQSINMSNKVMSKYNKTGFNGVSWCNFYKKYVSYINIDKKRKTIGYYKIKEDAINARKEYSKRNGYTVSHGTKGD